MRIPMMLFMLVLVVCLAEAPAAYSQQDDARDKEQKKTEQTDDLEALRNAAAAEAEKEATSEEAAEEKSFKSGNLGLQALNPEISVTGDMLGNYQSGKDDAVAWDTLFRGVGIHIEAYLDPYSRFKAALPFSTEGAELGEVYFTRYGVLGNMNLTLGKFRQQFGVVNRWHKHALDCFDFPLALTSVFGPGGLNQIGLSLEWSASIGRLVNGLIVQVTDGDNPRIFGGNTENRPSILGHYKAYQDLSPSTYLEIGLTGLAGWNDYWTTADTAFVDTLVTKSFEDTRIAAVYGVDLTLMWEPTGSMRYHNLQWRSEGYYVDKEIYAPDGLGVDRLNPWGFYSLLQAKVSRTIELGVRYDYFTPDTKKYASLCDDMSLAPLATAVDGAYRQSGVVWMTWWQSPFVKFRGGYSYETGEGIGPDVHYVTFQMVFAAGPHKHERY